jgi:hypothetical protein
MPDVPSLAFVHIPAVEFMNLWSWHPTNGSKAEAVNCPSVNSGLFQSLQNMSVTALYSGHDHNNNYYGRLKGIRLAYG